MSTSGPHAPYGCRNVVPPAVSLAGVYVSPVLVYALLAPMGRLFAISAGKASFI